jgi:prolycopene isomerase
MASLGEVVDEFVTDPKAKALCTAAWPYMGPPPSKASFMVYAGLLYATLETGPIYVEGSFQKLVDAFVTAIERSGGELVFRTRVTRIPVEGGRVKGVMLDDGREIKAATVVSNADALQTFERLIGREHLPPPLQRQLQRFQLSDSAFVLFAATTVDPAQARLPHEVLIFKHWDHEQTYGDVLSGKPGGMWITFPTTFDPELAPEGEHLVIMSSLAPYDVGVSWPEARERYTESLLDEVEAVLPGFRGNTTFVETATPETFERYTLNDRGSIYGWAATPHQSAGKRLKQRTPIHGLFLSGHWTEPGAGSFRAIFSGVIATTLILGLDGLKEFGRALGFVPTSP